MPVRKIPKNYLHVTGGFSSRKNGRMLGYESLLERDFMLLLEYDPTVERFEEQPVSMKYAGQQRGNIPYTPDVLVQFIASVARPPELVEVKHTSDLRKNEEKYRPKFAAAREYAEAQGWVFKIVTEVDIRTPLLSNLKFLRAYRNTTSDTASINAVLLALDDAGGSASILKIQQYLREDATTHLPAMATLWHMIATGQLHADLSKPLGNPTMIQARPLP